MKKHLIILPMVLLLISASLGQTQAERDALQAEEEKPITNDEFLLPVDQGTAAEIDKMIPLLNSPDYNERENASNVLLSIGATAFSKLRTAYHEADELETQLRIERIVHQAYRTHHVFNKNGFLGIQMNTREMPNHEDDPRIPESHFGIKLSVITENTGAERAGLQKDDIIIGCNDNPLEGQQRQAFEYFSNIIRSTGPGGQIRVTVLRGEETLDITATLGPVPQEMYTRVTGMNELVQVTDRRFAIWWSQFFLIDDENENDPD